jgi:hypothetical protein
MAASVPDTDRLRGSIPPLVTPFRAGKVDERAYAKLVEFQISQGSHGILVNGTTSEPSTLTIEERNRLVEVAVETARRRILVVAATGSQSLAETEVLTAHAARVGVDALLIVTPYYIRPPQRGLIDYFRLIFPSLPGRDEVLSLSSLIGLGWRAMGFQETAPAYRPSRCATIVCTMLHPDRLRSETS